MRVIRHSIYMLLAISGLLGSSGFAQSQSRDFVPGEVLVKLKSSHGSSQASVFHGKALSQKGMRLKQSFSRMNLYHYSLRPGADVNREVEDLKSDPNVEYAEPNYYISKSSIDSEIHPLSAEELQAFVTKGSVFPTGAPIQAMETWPVVPLPVVNSKPIVAVIDTGLDTTHPAFSGSQAVWTNPGEIPANGLDDDGNGYIDDVNGWNFVINSGSMYDDDGHGTHVSGIILSLSENIFTAPFSEAKIQIMPLKFLDGSGVGKTSDAIKAIYYAVDNGARVMNNSWGGPNYSAALLDAIAYSYNQGVVFSAAAGNSGTNNDMAPMYPASYDVPNIISVAATTDQDDLAGFSNYGLSTVDVGSPGVYIVSSVPGGGYAPMSGTSMATPFVSGLAALMLIESPNMMAYQLRQIILQNSDSVTGLHSKLGSGGRINALNSVTDASTATVQTSQPAYAPNAQNRDLASSLANAGGGCGLVKSVYDGIGKGPGSPRQSPETGLVLLVVLLASVPFIIWSYLRARDPKQRRRYERFKIDSNVTVAMGGKRLVGSISTISMGGVQLNTEALLEKGSLMTLTISSPDGEEQIEVQGRVVWSEANKAYGVEFAQAESSALDMISRWTRSLVRSG